MSEALSSFALKVAEALEDYSQRSPQLSTSRAPLHMSMLKMAESLKYKQSKMQKMQKTAFGLLELAPGLLAGAGAKAMYERFLPGMQQRVLGGMPGQKVLEHGVADIVGRAGGGTAGRDAILEALQKIPGMSGAGSALEHVGNLHSAPLMGVKPWQMGLAGVGGLAAGQMMANRDKSGPPMIIA